jgi:aspartate/methionine/tyrosine aminotransferase
MMRISADQFLADCMRQIDDAICECAVTAAQHLLDAGAKPDDLPRLMRPIVRRLAERRAAAVAKLTQRTGTLHAIELSIAVHEALLERDTTEAVVH